jgi:hypothetical protein
MSLPFDATCAGWTAPSIGFEGSLASVSGFLQRVVERRLLPVDERRIEDTDARRAAITPDQR